MLTFPSSLSVPVCYTNLAVFILGALALTVPSGYSLGSALLVLAGLWSLTTRHRVLPGRQSLAVMGVLAGFAGLGIAGAILEAQGWRGIDKPLRPLLAVVALFWLLRYPPRPAWVWGGFALGALGAGGWAAWQKLIEGAARAEGHILAIQFGNLCLLLGSLCLAGLGWAMTRPRWRVWITVLLLGALAGILGSLFAGSRGGWVGFPMILLVLYRGYGRQLTRRRMLGIAVASCLAVGTAYLLPQTGVQHRVDRAVDEVRRYVAGESRTSSVGARFEMWKGATRLIMEKPLLGWGESGYRQGMQGLADEGVIHPGVTIYDHAHNDFIDAFAKRGMLGLAALLALYLVPMRRFSRHLTAADPTQRSVAIAGVLLPVAYIDFGLSQAFLAHNSGIMMYSFLLVVLWSMQRSTMEQIP